MRVAIGFGFHWLKTQFTFNAQYENRCTEPFSAPMNKLVTCENFSDQALTLNRILTLQTFGFINGVDKCNVPPYRDFKS